MSDPNVAFGFEGAAEPQVPPEEPTGRCPVGPGAPGAENN